MEKWGRQYLIYMAIFSVGQHLRSHNLYILIHLWLFFYTFTVGIHKLGLQAVEHTILVLYLILQHFL